MVKALFWNSQGALDPDFNRYLSLFIRQHDPDVVVLMEPRISGRKADRFIRRHRFLHSYRVEASGFSGGIWLFWNDLVSMDVFAVSSQFIHALCTDRNSGVKSLVTCVYASPNRLCRNGMWDMLHALAPSSDLPWVIDGDFNAILDSRDRFGGSSRRTGVCRKFGEFMQQENMTDMGFQGPRFT
ncbi:hypothetical protein HRI_004044300 [Hibiscus trionum]|uniref:Endonuclease/exonuclease/phosphatase domain-containing protein n=1 Tax=Hibiscus trionum TaxID=183268 RepID=A0A9W7IXL3_HIBTR|nr:hypothetical protein HRI_004044300 [Hibiscus trionum]